MTRTEDDIVIHSEDLLEVATSVGGSGTRASAGGWSSRITKRLILCIELCDIFEKEKGIKEK